MARHKARRGHRTLDGRKSGKRGAAAWVLMLLGVALIGYGTHYLARNGSCSSTGYVSYGPVPKAISMLARVSAPGNGLAGKLRVF